MALTTLKAATKIRDEVTPEMVKLFTSRMTRVGRGLWLTDEDLIKRIFEIGFSAGGAVALGSKAKDLEKLLP